jgi:hypothetical protein
MLAKKVRVLPKENTEPHQRQGCLFIHRTVAQKILNPNKGTPKVMAVSVKATYRNSLKVNKREPEVEIALMMDSV